MTVLAGSSVSIKTMADGTLRLTVDIEPNDAQEAFKLFGAPGRGIALAALIDGHAAKSPEPPKEKLGPLATLAVQWCKSPEFQHWLGDEDIDEATARQTVLSACGITSRKELDANPEAASRFETSFRKPFAKHLKDNGLTI